MSALLSIALTIGLKFVGMWIDNQANNAEMKRAFLEWVSKIDSTDKAAVKIKQDAAAQLAQLQAQPAQPVQV